MAQQKSYALVELEKIRIASTILEKRVYVNRYESLRLGEKAMRWSRLRKN